MNNKQKFYKCLSLIAVLLWGAMLMGCNDDDDHHDWIKGDFSRSNVIYVSKKENKTTTSHSITTATCFVNTENALDNRFRFDCQIDNSPEVYALHIDCTAVGNATLFSDLSVGEKLDINQFQAILFFHTLATEYRLSFPQATNGNIIVERNTILDNERIITLRLDNLLFKEDSGRYEGTYILNGTVDYKEMEINH